MSANHSRIVLPEVVAERTDSENIVLELRIPEALAYFAGHFPAAPIVPGVVQIHWAMHFAREKFGLSLLFRHMEAVKFKELMLPGQHLELQLHYTVAAAKLGFCFRSQEHEYSSGRIYFRGSEV